MATNTKKVGYSVPEVCQILHMSSATLYRLINDKAIECLITDPKTPGGRRQFRFLKEHIQHYMLKNYDKFEDTTLRTWGVMTTPKKYIANASTPRIPIEAFSKQLADTPVRPENPNMSRVSPDTWTSKPAPKKPFLRQPAQENKSEATEPKAAPAQRDAREPFKQKSFPKFRLEVDLHAGEMVIPNEVSISGIESSTAADIAKALMNDRNIRIKEIRITFDGLTSDKEG